MEIYFDGYCPESLLKGRQVEMRLNEDDFWESEATGLQMTVFPPFATILRWRGKGKFRQSSEVASNSLVGLVMTAAQTEEGKEIFPNEERIIHNQFDLERYLDEIYDSKEQFEAAKFDPDHKVFSEQTHYLNTIPKKEFQKLVELSDALKERAYDGNIMDSKPFQQLHKMLYDLKLIFNFKWMDWQKGRKNINYDSFDFSDCSLLELSMYLTVIFRAERFCDGTIEANFDSGTLYKIFDALRLRTSSQ